MITREKFLEPEIRDGVEVSAELKATWKVMLDILEVIMTICKRHGLEWTLEGGSLLGAMRHKGFIPWDDDVDIVMPRRDYDKFIKYASKELPSYYFCQNTATARQYHCTHTTICDSRTAAIEPNHADGHKVFNMGIHIDVFALDGMPRSLIARKVVTFFVLWMRSAIPTWDYKRRRLTILGVINRAFWSVVRPLIGNVLIFWLRELPLRMLPMCRYEWCGSAVAKNFWDPHSLRKTEWFNEYIQVPFEYLMVPVPKAYDKILTQQFKEWRTPKKGYSHHATLYLDYRESYMDVLIKRYGYRPEEFEQLEV